MVWRIGILQLTPALDDAVDGFRSRMKELGYIEGTGYEVFYRNVQGDVPRLSKEAEEMKNADVQLIFACGTPSAKAAAALPVYIPVVFTPVFDPVAVGLVDNPAHPGGKVTGVSGRIRAAKKLDLLCQVAPSVTTVAVIHTQVDPNTRLEVDDLTHAGASLGLEMLDLPVAGAPEAVQAIEGLNPGKVAVLVPIDRGLETEMKSVAEAAANRGIPLMAPNGAGVRAGALMAIDANHEELGRQAAEMAVAIKQGMFPGDLAVAEPRRPILFLNAAVAERLGIKLKEAYPLESEVVGR